MFRIEDDVRREPGAEENKPKVTLSKERARNLCRRVLVNQVSEARIYGAKIGLPGGPLTEVLNLSHPLLPPQKVYLLAEAAQD